MATTTYNNTSPMSTRNNNTLYWAIGIGVVILALLALFAMRNSTPDVSSSTMSQPGVTTPSSTDTTNGSTGSTNMSGAGSTTSGTHSNTDNDTHSTTGSSTNEPEETAPNTNR